MQCQRGQIRSLRHLIEASAGRDPGAIAITAPGRMPLTYSRLLRHLNEVHHALNRSGVGCNDRVALVVPNGPELAAAFLSVAAAAVCAPLNPEYREVEFDFYLTDLKASALIVSSDIDSPVRRSARRQRIPIIELMPESAEAGLFTLRSERAGGSASGRFATAQETALVLHTSGTTARPKRVPLTHSNLCSIAENNITAMELSGQDRCLNMLPLYYAVGIFTMLGVLAAGGSVVCPPHIYSDAFFEWLAEFRPTWFAATPPTHHAILSRAQDYRDLIARCPLRFIRSGAGAISPRALEGLEQVFGVPVIVTYGMTEAGLISCSPLPPRPRKAGSVGTPACLDVAIMDEAGTLLPPETAGEVVVRGPTITRGYEDHPGANAAAFRHGWFRTGDLGVLDADGYLFLRGRLKDLINRGGQKILPQEVEETLLAHPAITAAVAFPLPHPTLGEDVAAAVVLRPDAQTPESDLRRWAAAYLSAFKVPCRIVSVPELPVGPTGKVRRQDLSDHFSANLATPFVAPEDPLEEMIARIWAEELRIDHVGVHETFFELGGDSLSAARMCARVQATTGRALSADAVWKSPTVAQLARLLEQKGVTGRSLSSLVPIQAGGSRPPLFCLHGTSGHVPEYYPLARHLDPDQPVFGLQVLAVEGTQPPHTRIESMAARYVEEIRTFFPRGPYLLCGYSMAGLVAWEVAQQLHAQGQRVALLALLDTFFSMDPAFIPERDSAPVLLFRRAQSHLDNLQALTTQERLTYVPQRLKAWWHRLAGGAFSSANTKAAPRARPQTAMEPPPDLPPVLQALWRVHTAAGHAYIPHMYPGPITLFLARRRSRVFPDPRLPGQLAGGPVEIHRVRGTHSTFLKEPLVRVLAKLMKGCIDRAIEPCPPFRSSPILSASRTLTPDGASRIATRRPWS